MQESALTNTHKEKSKTILAQVKLSNVLDLQLLEVLHRTAGSSKPNSAKNGEYWQLKARSVNRLWGYKKCLGVYLKDEDLVAIKDKGAEEILASKAMTQNVRAKRPLTDTLKKYCAVNTQVGIIFKNCFKKFKISFFLRNNQNSRI